jgi:exodeoxyribonuclease V gamma subunit
MESFTAALDVLDGRLPASAVLDLLALAPVRERFGIAAEELETIRVWVTESGIRWGIDASHRAAVGQPLAGEHTWRFGFDRLLVGYAAPTDERALYQGVLPYDDVEGVEADLLGRFVACCELLFEARARLAHPRPLAQWRDDLAALLSAMVAVTTQNAYQHEGLRRALGTVAERAARAGFDGAVDRESVRAQLEREIAAGKSARGLLAGGVTFCELVPMRSIPFRVVCLLGLNHDTFPRTRRAPGFDLIAQSPRIGDRNARDDDRYLFLEALLSARERLIITDVGRSIGDNRELPPSVVVTEMLDALDRTCGGDPPAADRIVSHPLQPFSPRYFDGAQPSLFSYAPREYAGARALRRERGAAPPFLMEALPAAEPLTAVTLDDLLRFFANPSRWLLEERLGLYLRKRDQSIDDREPLALDRLESWQIGDKLLTRACSGEAPDPQAPLLRASGALPPGALGTVAFGALVPQVHALADTVAMARGGARTEPLPIDVVIDGVRITGVLRDLFPGGQVTAQFSKLGRRHELRQWIRHLALNAMRPGMRSFLVGRAAEKKGRMYAAWRPVHDAAALLAVLLDLYRIGRRLPLPLFPQSSRNYVERLRAGDQREDALAKVATKFRTTGDRGAWAEGDDPSVAHIYADPAPFYGTRVAGAPSFEDVAQLVFEPFIDHLEGDALAP